MATVAARVMNSTVYCEPQDTQGVNCNTKQVRVMTLV